MILGLFLILNVTLFYEDNKEFFDTAAQEYKEGARWHKVGPRPPDPTAKALTLAPPNGEPYIIWKLKK